MKLFSVKQVAEFVGVDKSAVYKAISIGELKPFGRTGKGIKAHYRFSEQNITDWLQGNLT